MITKTSCHFIPNVVLCASTKSMFDTCNFGLIIGFCIEFDTSSDFQAYLFEKKKNAF